MVQLPSEIDLDREIARQSLAGFVRAAWHVLEPTTPLKWGWALDAICEHLEAVTRGEIKRLLINVPPGCMKSLVVGVFWPAWEWGPQSKPETRYLGTAHKQDLGVRDNVKCRRLITSGWYQERWPVAIVNDQNAKTKFENQTTGFRECMAFTSLTGSRGDRVLIDDPHSVDDANSPTKLLAAETTFLEAVPSRVNNDESAIIVIMQRLHSRDVAGVILLKELPYVHLCLPMRFEAERRCVTPIGFKDPRKKDGELLFPERFSEEETKELEKTLGTYASAGQLQQRPAPREGGMFKRDWFPVVRAVPIGTRFVRGWDLAATAKGGDWTAGAKIGQQPDGRYIIAHMARGQLSAAGVRKLLRNTTSQDGYATTVSLPQDPGQAGKDQMSSLTLLLSGYIVKTSPETGSKEQRAGPLAAQAEAGNVDILEGDWNEAFFEEANVFPNGTKDQIDAASRAFNELALGFNFDIEAMT